MGQNVVLRALLFDYAHMLHIQVVFNQIATQEESTRWKSTCTEGRRWGVSKGPALAQQQVNQHSVGYSVRICEH